MNDYTSDVVIHILYKDTLDARVSEDEVVLLNSLPTEEIIPILQRVFYQEHDDVVKSRAFDAIVSIQAFEKFNSC
jgi:predicted RNA-binding protein with PUA domain